MAKTIEEIEEIIKRFVGPNGAYILMTDDGSHAEFRTGGSSTTVMGLNTIGSEYVQQMLFAKFNSRLTGKDADLVKGQEQD